MLTNLNSNLSSFDSCENQLIIKLSLKQLKQDESANATVASFIGSIREGAAQPIPSEEILEVARVTIDLDEKCR